MTRFMMSLKQATELTIKAMGLARGGEIFVLKMPIVRLSDLADIIISNSAQHLNIDPNDIAIEEIGIRSGEKMYEELMTAEESDHALETDEMFIIRNSFMTVAASLYHQAKRTDRKSYSSSSEVAISNDELRSLLVEDNLLF